MKELERSLNIIAKYCDDENEYYSSEEYLEWEKLNAKYQEYYYDQE